MVTFKNEFYIAIDTHRTLLRHAVLYNTGLLVQAQTANCEIIPAKFAARSVEVEVREGGETASVHICDGTGACIFAYNLMFSPGYMSWVQEAGSADVVKGPLKEIYCNVADAVLLACDSLEEQV